MLYQSFFGHPVSKNSTMAYYKFLDTLWGNTFLNTMADINDAYSAGDGLSNVPK